MLQARGPGPSAAPVVSTAADAGRDIYRGSGGARMQSALNSMMEAPLARGGGRENLGINDVRMTEILGRDRHKFFRRPVVPYIQAAPADVVLSRIDSQGSPSRPAASAASKKVTLMDEMQSYLALARTTGTQTDYRESEAQTDPFTPDYFVPPGHNPEVLMLAHLTYANGGLPAGQDEIEMIDRLRRRRQVEASLPPITDEASVKRRLELLTELEMKEWSEREQQIQDVQDERLRLIDTALHRREVDREEKDRSKVVSMKNRKLEDATKKLNSIREQRQREFRRLERMRPPTDLHPKKRDVVAEYSDMSSKVYAPKLREGIFTDKIPIPEPQPFLLETYDGINVLEHTTDRQPLLLTPKEGYHGSESKSMASKKKKLLQDVEFAQHVLEETRTGANEQEKLEVLDLYRKTPRVVRPPTPTLTIDVEMEERVSAAVLLQRLLRGRSSQNLMFEGKERSLELITELRKTQDIKDLEQQQMVELERERLERQQKMFLDSLEEMVEGDIIGKALHFLAEELPRSREIERISSFADIARETRRRREAEESGTRQLEEELRAREDLQYTQVMRAVNVALNSWLDDTISSTIDQCAERRATFEVCSRGVTEFDLPPGDVDGILPGGQDEVIVRDLVSSFLLPEVERSIQRSNRRENEDVFMYAAHTALIDSLHESHL